MLPGPFLQGELKIGAEGLGQRESMMMMSRDHVQLSWTGGGSLALVIFSIDSIKWHTGF